MTEPELEKTMTLQEFQKEFFKYVPDRDNKQKLFARLGLHSLQAVVNQYRVKREQSELANQYLDTCDYDSFLGMMDMGYTPNKKQIRAFHDKFLYVFFNSYVGDDYNSPKPYWAEYALKDFKILERALESKHFSITPGLAKAFLKYKKLDRDLFMPGTDYVLEINTSFDTLQVPYLTREIQRNLHTPGYSKTIFTQWVNSIFKDRDSIGQFQDSFEVAPEYFLHEVSAQEFTQLCSSMSRRELYYGTAELFARKFKEYYKDNQKMVDIMKNPAQKPSPWINLEQLLTHLPDNTQKEFISMKTLYDKVLSHASFDKHEKQDCEKLYRKVIEQLQTYNKLNRDIVVLSSEGKTPETLVQESIEVLKLKLAHELEIINQNHVTELSVTNRYLKALK